MLEEADDSGSSAGKAVRGNTTLAGGKGKPNETPAGTGAIDAFLFPSKQARTEQNTAQRRSSRLGRLQLPVKQLSVTALTRRESNELAAAAAKASQEWIEQKISLHKE